MKPRLNSGFTLLELMATLLVASIALGLGVPSLWQFIRNSRMTSVTNDFISAIHLARNEANTRHATTTLCASPNPVAANPSCNPDVALLSGGYIVWVDSDSDAVVDVGEEVVFQAAGQDNIAAIGDNGYIHFDHQGFVDDIAAEGNSASLILFCDSRGNVMTSGATSAARAVRIAPTGRPSVLTGVDEITASGAACP
jgi:type IV fimbrial biogenesis protein FimT